MTGRSRDKPSLARRVWGFLTSRKVALVLLLIALVFLTTALWIPQLPPELDEAGRAEWRDDLRQQYGSRLDSYERLGLTHVYSTPAFLGLLAALLVNTLSCTLDRISAVWRWASRRPAHRLPEAAYGKADWTVEGVTPEEARRLLQRIRFRVRWRDSGPSLYAYAETSRLPALGTVVSHLGLLFLALAALLHTQISWRERLLLDPQSLAGEGAISLQHRPSCSVANVGSLADKGGIVRGELLVDAGGTQIRRWTAPSSAVRACGVRFHLNSYGLTLQPEVSDRNGQPVLTSPAEQDGTLLRFPEGRAEATFDVPDLGWHVSVAPSAGALAGLTEEPLSVRVDRATGGAALLEAEIDPSDSLELPGGGRLSFTAGTFLVVDAVHDPGFPFFLAAGLSLTLGSGCTLLLPQRRLWARLTEEGTLQVRFGTREEDSRSEEIRVLTERLARQRGGAA